MSKVILGRRGESLVVELPSDIAADLALTAGSTLDVERRNDEIVVRKAGNRLTLEDMFAGKTAEEWRAIYAGSDPWGPDVGREIIEE